MNVLKEITRKEANSKDIDGMTPTLWAAFEGNLEALRMLVARGGDPDKSDQFGNTALHFAAAKGHMQLVDFLVNFGVNIYALDIDHHSAKDLAAMNNNDDILRLLDSAMATLEQNDRKKAKSLKEQAQKYSDKKAKQYSKKQQKHEQEMDVKPMPHRPSTGLAALKQKLLRTGSHGNLNNNQQQQGSAPALRRDTLTVGSQNFSSIVGGTLSGAPRSAVQRKAQLAQRAKLQQQMVDDNVGDFKVGEVEPGGGRSVRSLQGVRRDSEVLYVGTFSSNGGTGKRGKIADVFEVDDDIGNEEDNEGQLPRTLSQPNFFGAVEDDDLREQVMLQRPSGLFDRPLLGSLAFPYEISN